jgi:tRNA A-37 threonylcarbamoyl transferase component Bud32
MADAKKSVRLSSRTLAQAGLDGLSLEVFKSDSRSRVWLVDGSDNKKVVVKQFVYQPLRQQLARCVGYHPAQRELNGNDRLKNAGVPVVPVFDCGIEDGKAWLATPYLGESLLRCLRKGEQIHVFIDAAAILALTLISAGYTFKDLKPSNMIIDERGQAHLIDAGSVKRSVSPSEIHRMLGVMDRVLARDGIENGYREQFARKIQAGLKSL